MDELETVNAKWIRMISKDHCLVFSLICGV